MKKILLVCLAVIVLVFGLLLSGCGKKEQSLAKNEYRARVEWIHDGDTVTVVDDKMVKHKIRLYAIDAPELAQRGGKESMKNLIKILPKNQWVTIEVEGMDRYQREVATIYFNEENINRRQIADGHAWHFVKYDKKYMSDYSMVENKARKQKIGLWKDTNPQAPWDYRQIKKDKK